ncbi:hypothetical protein ABVT39_007227 [Epinephelus coioides]
MRGKGSENGKRQDSVYKKNKDTEGVRRGGARRVFIYTVGFMASCVCCVAWEPSPPGRRKQHHFRLECPLRRQVSCQKAHGCRIPTKSTDLFPNNCCVHLSHSTERPLSRHTGASVSPLTLNAHSQHDSPITAEHVTVTALFDRHLIKHKATVSNANAFAEASSFRSDNNPTTVIKDISSRTVFQSCLKVTPRERVGGEGS